MCMRDCRPTSTNLPHLWASDRAPNIDKFSHPTPSRNITSSMAEDDHGYPNLNHLHHLFTPSLNSLSSSPLLLPQQLPLLPNIQDQSVPDQTAAAPDVTIDWAGAGLLAANAIDQKETPLPSSSSSSKLGRGLAKKRALNPPRIAFHTRSSEDVLDDGYRWRKYGQKAVKNSLHPRYLSIYLSICLSVYK